MHRLVFLAILLAAPVFGQEQAADLRAAAGCGPTKTQFDVKVDKKQHSVSQVEPGKALVYVCPHIGAMAFQEAWAAIFEASRKSLLPTHRH